MTQCYSMYYVYVWLLRPCVASAPYPALGDAVTRAPRLQQRQLVGGQPHHLDQAWHMAGEGEVR